MKYLLSTLEYPPQIGGVANYYGNLIAHWPQGDEWTVIDNSRGELVGKGRLGWLKAIKTICSAQKAVHYDLIFVGQILPLGTVALLASLFTKFEYGIFLHGMDLPFALRSQRKRWLSRMILMKAKHIVCANSYVQSLLFDFLPSVKGKSILLNPGASAGMADETIKNEYRQRYGLTGKKIIFSIGRLVKRKGFDQVLSALSTLAGEDFIYLLAGDGPERENLESLSVSYGLASKIIFLGRISEAEKWSCLDLCDIFITTSRNLDGDFEGFGIVYLEANLMSKPVIAGNAGGVADAVADGLSGILVDPEKVEDISAALKRLLTDSDGARRLGANGRTRALADFSWDGQALKLEQALKDGR